MLTIKNSFSYLPYLIKTNMRTASLLFAIVSIVIACSNNKTEETPVVVKGKTLSTLPVIPEKIMGTYIGDFKGSPIAITLNYVGSNHATGYNIHKGLKRNISGTIESDANGLHLVMEEPGNNQYDGKFDFVIDTTKWTGSGTWKPFKKGDAANFTLRKQLGTSDDEQWGSTYMDSLQNYIILKPDGSCTYSYLTDTTKTGQEITISGNYSKDKNTYTVFWQKNDVFPQKSTFKLIEVKPNKDEEYVEKSLKGEGKLFTQMWD
jgi:hypothetical protein